MELLVTLDALKRASVRRATAVMPYYGYARQDRKSGPRTPISAKLVANMIAAAGADRVLTLDLHAGQIQGFFDIPLDNLFAAPVFIDDIKQRYNGGDLVVVSPDVGGVVRARAIARRVDADLAIIDKRRERAGVSEVMNIIGEVEGRRCILIDDIVDSAGTLCNAAEALIERGAKSVAAYVTHGVLSGGAVARVAASPLEALVTTDSIAATEAVRAAHNIRRLTIAPLMAEAILRISEERSVSSLFVETSLPTASGTPGGRRITGEQRSSLWLKPLLCAPSRATGPERGPPGPHVARAACRVSSMARASRRP
jgi:ribose-phosphate pyrophosphokinase